MTRPSEVPSRRLGAARRPLLVRLLTLFAATSGAIVMAPRGWAQTKGSTDGTAAASDADWTLVRLFDEMGGRKQARARFAERQFLALLDAPVDATGELVFEAPGKLIKRTIKPRPELLAVDGDQVTVERPGLRRTMSLNEMPGVAALIESLRATLGGDRETLLRVFEARLSGTRARWTLLLTPRQSQAAQLIKSVTLTGSGRDIELVEVEQRDGDRSVMRIIDSR
ncbi:MAG: LolA-related protein [Burkholderiaceae bacterium]